MSSVHHVDGLPPEILDMYPDGISRRRFLSLLSASAALAMGTSCSIIDRGSIVPYTKHPGEIKPGIAAYYASTFQEGWNVQGVLVKTREGRPIHIEGNPEHPVSRGTVSLRAMGDLLGLYDPDRLRGPSFKGKAVAWEEAEQAMARALEEARSGKQVLLLAGAAMSPSRAALFDDLKSALPGLQYAFWEPCIPVEQLETASLLFGNPVIPKLYPDRAEVILSLQSDFLGNDGIASVFIRDFAARRRISIPSDRMNRLWVFEGPMTLTGSNADERIRVRPSGIAPLVFALIRLLKELRGIPLPQGLRAEDLESFEPEQTAAALGVAWDKLKFLAEDLARARRSALVLAGPSLPKEAHIASHLLNTMVEAEGNTIDSEKGIRIPGILSNADLANLLNEAAGGKFASAIFWGVNPAYAFPDTALWEKAAARIPEGFRIGLYEDETAVSCGWRLPEHHWLESWGDFRSTSDFVSLRQPAIGPLHDTRQGEDILLACMRRMKLPVPASYSEYIKARWNDRVYSKGPVSFEDYWNGALHDGGVKCGSGPNPVTALKEEAVRNAAASAGNSVNINAPDGVELLLSPGTGVYDGRYSNNGWLNELPDPVSKATWVNPVSLSILDAKRLGVVNGDMVEVSNGETTVETLVLVQPGQCDGVAAIALGYGRRTGNVASGIGVNAYPLMNISSGSPLFASGISIRRKSTPENHPIPFTQTHDRMEGRDAARSWTLDAYAAKAAIAEEHAAQHSRASLIPKQKFPGHKWEMVVDLSACVGCSACVIACQSENNIPVVGPERILRGRHMHWIRVDRYYEGDAQAPEVRHQPMFCQHCDDAPCEIVCPVNATTHSPDGLNQMVYNRCVGTRYCSNNCPFKVRRFNFFEYNAMKKAPENLVFNPEVSVRPRGVMEKCTFCIQRIENAKQKAKVEGRPIRDGDIHPACVRACPAGALVFGDINDPQSRVAKLSKMDRGYRVLEELGIGPSVVYLVDISNPAGGKEGV